jgi:hypothetical protein
MDDDLSMAERDRVARITTVSNTAHRIALEELSGDVFLASYKAAFHTAFEEAAGKAQKSSGHCGNQQMS